ncbi:MAG: oligosaccharide flippase family protein [Candidatus Dadabacteria bacterium]|nr:oligosaccharide flippase family protein [Candidatus Dadabacteria bacterium]
MSKPNSEKKNFLKDASWLFSGEMGRSVFAGLETIILARFLGLEQFGVFALVISFVGIVNGLLDLNIKEPIVKYVGMYRERNDKEKTLSFVKFFYLVDFLSGAAAFAVAVLLAGVANEFFIKSEGAVELVVIYSFYLLVVTLNKNSQSLLVVFQKFKRVTTLTVTATGIRFLFVAAALIGGTGIKGVLAAHVAAGFVNSVIFQFFIHRTLRDEGLGGWIFANLGAVKGEMRGVVSFTLSSTYSAFIGNVFDKNIAVLVLGNLFDSSASGLYKTAAVFSKIIGRVVTPATRALYPALVRLEEQRSYADFRKVVSYSTKLLLKIIVPAGAAGFIFADEIITIFFGAEYTGAANAMRIILAAELLSGFSFWIPSAYLALGRAWFRAFLQSGGAVLYAAALFLLTPAYALEGAAFARFAPLVILLPMAAFLFMEIKKRERLM